MNLFVNCLTRATIFCLLLVLTLQTKINFRASQNMLAQSNTSYPSDALNRKQ